MSGAITILRRLWYRDPSTLSSPSPSSTTNSPSDKVFPAIARETEDTGRDRAHQRGSVGSEYSSSSRTSSPHRLVRALSSRFRPRSRTANSQADPNPVPPPPETPETLKYKRPKSAVRVAFFPWTFFVFICLNPVDFAVALNSLIERPRELGTQSTTRHQKTL